MYYGDYGDYGTPPPKKTDAKKDGIYYRVGSVQKYKIGNIDSIYGTIELISLDDKTDKIYSSFSDFEKHYKEVWF